MSKDPVCGMAVDGQTDLVSTFGGVTYHFCSPACKRHFEQQPGAYVAGSPDAETKTRGSSRRIAYFSMEIAASAEIPTYSGGLGILAGDTLRAFADQDIPVVGVTLLYRNGYFLQTLNDEGWQAEEPVLWHPEQHLERVDRDVHVQIEGRDVVVGAWIFRVQGCGAGEVPLVFLDTDRVENDPIDRALTGQLYGGGDRQRLAQEVILGIGGVRMLRALGHDSLRIFHLNEGHAALLTLELLRETQGRGQPTWRFDDVREECVFTTHTPVDAGHDKFTYDLASRVLGDVFPLDMLKMLGGDEVLNMTRLALNASHFVNGVAKEHARVSQGMFPGYPINSITNGVHSATWVADSFRGLFDAHFPGWRGDSFLLRGAVQLTGDEIWEAHRAAKRQLIQSANRAVNARLEESVLTLGFARRATQYKRADLVFRDLERLRSISANIGRLQLVFAGKAHPRDERGKALIHEVHRSAKLLAPDLRVVYLPDYDMELARSMVSGVDVWLNTPCKPMEASGTSGMKAAHNGVPSLSVLDGWWLEGHIEGVTGWSIGSREVNHGDDEAEARELYEKLEGVIVPTFYHDRHRWLAVMRSAIAINASFFNTQRMVQQYALSAYLSHT